MSSENGREFEGKVAIITGASRNIGRAIALSLAEGGAAVTVNARTSIAEAEAVASDVPYTKPRFTPAPARHAV